MVLEDRRDHRAFEKFGGGLRESMIEYMPQGGFGFASVERVFTEGRISSALRNIECKITTIILHASRQMVPAQLVDRLRPPSETPLTSAAPF
jgi:hypothetical protein